MLALLSLAASLASAVPVVDTSDGALRVIESPISVSTPELELRLENGLLMPVLDGGVGVGMVCVCDGEVTLRPANDRERVAMVFYGLDAIEQLERQTTSVRIEDRTLIRPSDDQVIEKVLVFDLPRLDATGGQSGSPIYYPEGCCGAHFAHSVLASHYYRNANWHNGGPKIRDIRTWAIAQIQ